jgi:hypothetical protein
VTVKSRITINHFIPTTLLLPSSYPPPTLLLPSYDYLFTPTIISLFLLPSLPLDFPREFVEKRLRSVNVFEFVGNDATESPGVPTDRGFSR